MGKFIRALLPDSVRFFITVEKEKKAWRARGFTSPSPANIKREVLSREGIPHATWVETGTFLGDTSAFLARTASRVITIEPAQTLYERAKARFARNPTVEIINGPSEAVFPKLLPTLSGDVNFWLDGHYSAGMTHKGSVDTPIEEELETIAKCLPRFRHVAILVDDIRLFHPKINKEFGYPDILFLINWARTHGFSWHIEHDIFIAKNF